MTRQIPTEATTILDDKGYVSLIETWGSDERIIESARMSVNRGFIAWDTYSRCRKCNMTLHDALSMSSVCDHDMVEVPKGDAGLLKTLYNNKHTTPFEMCGATFEIQAPIIVFREWHRHRTQSYSEMSARYTPLPDVNYVPTVERLMMTSTTNKQAQSAEFSSELNEESAKAWLESLQMCYEDCEGVYQEGLKLGVPKELARLIVPVGRYSRMRASANLLNWIRFLTLRLAPSAQLEIREYAGAVCEFLSTAFPRTMELFGQELIDKMTLPKMA